MGMSSEVVELWVGLEQNCATASTPYSFLSILHENVCYIIERVDIITYLFHYLQNFTNNYKMQGMTGYYDLHNFRQKCYCFPDFHEDVIYMGYLFLSVENTSKIIQLSQPTLSLFCQGKVISFIYIKDTKVKGEKTHTQHTSTLLNNSDI